jgi:DNA-binding SARP family transcriptional activator
MAELKLYLLGPPRLERAGLPLDLRRRKALALLAYLAVTGQPHSRAALVAFLWPEYDHRRGRADLSRTLSVLRKTLGPTALATDRKTVELNLERELWVDVHHFQQLLTVCKSYGHPENMVCAACLPPLQEAAMLYQADFLAGFTLPDSLDFDEWQFFQIEELRRDLMGALERLGRGYMGQDNLEEAIVYIRRWVGVDPIHEPAHRQLMTLYAQTGQRAAALRQYQVCEELLDRELGVPPQAETTALDGPERTFCHQRQSRSWTSGAKKATDISELSPYPTSSITRPKVW